MANILDLAAKEIAELRDGIRNLRITPKVSPREIREHLAAFYGRFESPKAAEALVADVVRMLRDWNLHVTHPRYFGLFNPSVHEEGIAADALVAAYNPQLAAWSHAPAANEIEQYTLRYFAGRLGLNPDSCAACFATGGAEANQSAVLAALTRALPEYPQDGLAGVERRPLIYVSSESHHSLEKVAHIAGLGRGAVRQIEVGGDLRFDLVALRDQILRDQAAGFLPLLVVGTAGTTGGGIVDPLPALAELCAEHDIWFHVDAAWGGAACLSPELAPAIAGIERADSVTLDAHKWLSVPMGAGMFFCAHPGAVRSSFAVHTPYMPVRVEDTIDPYVTSIQWTRRHIGLKVFMTLASLGERGMRDTIEHQARMGDLLRDRLRSRGWRIVNDTRLPVVCFTHRRIGSGSTSARRIVQLLQEDNLWVSEVRLGNMAPVVRACITSFLTQPSDIDHLVQRATHHLQNSSLPPRDAPT